MIYWLALARSVHIGGSILLAAVFVFRLIVWLLVTTSVLWGGGSVAVKIRRIPPPPGLCELDGFDPFGLAWLMLVAASIVVEAMFLGIPLDDLDIILFQMQFGHLWLFRFGCCLVLGVLLLIKRCESISAGLAILVVVGER